MFLLPDYRVRQRDYLLEISRAITAQLDVGGKGLMIGVEFVLDKETRTPAPELRDRIVDYAFEDDMLLLGCGTNAMRLIPPLSVEKDIVDEGLLIFERAIARAEEAML